MRYVVIFLLGVIMGVGGEFLIPKNKQFGQTIGCVEYKDLGVFIPEAYLYNSKTDQYPIGLVLEEGYVPSYRYLFALLTGEVRRLPNEECNKLIDLLHEQDEKHWREIIKDNP